MAKNVTMSEIAKDLGISTVSVSKAITGKDGVSDKVREMILKRADELGYVYNKSDKDGRPHYVGILVGEHFLGDESYYTKLYQKTLLMLSEKGQMGFLEIVKREDEDGLKTPQLITNNQVDAIIVLGQMKRDYLKLLKKSEIPLLYMDFYDEEVREDAVVSDSVYGAAILTNYLINLGHKDIAFVGSIKSTSSIMDRYMGYLKAMIKAGLETPSHWLIEDRDEGGMGIEINLPKKMPSAFVCNSDATAFELVRKLQSEGYKIPEDVSVVGFDNYIYSEISNPKITTYGVDTDALLSNVVTTIVNKIEDKDYAIGRIVVEGDMVERQSVGRKEV